MGQGFVAVSMHVIDVREKTVIQQNDITIAGHKPAQRRLDPADLPVRFAVADRACTDGNRSVVLDAERVVLARRLGPIAMKIALPVSSYRGIAMRIEMHAEEGGADRVTVILAHRDRALDIVLFEAQDDRDVIAEWRLWASTLGLPLLIEGLDGHLVAAESRLGSVTAGRPSPRRRYAFLAGRRPRFLTRRRMGAAPQVPVVFREDDETEFL